jgi:hypothetical protein
MEENNMENEKKKDMNTKEFVRCFMMFPLFILVFFVTMGSVMFLFSYFIKEPAIEEEGYIGLIKDFDNSGFECKIITYDNTIFDIPGHHCHSIRNNRCIYRNKYTLWNYFHGKVYQIKECEPD